MVGAAITLQYMGLLPNFARLGAGHLSRVFSGSNATGNRNLIRFVQIHCMRAHHGLGHGIAQLIGAEFPILHVPTVTSATPSPRSLGKREIDFAQGRV